MDIEKKLSVNSNLDQEELHSPYNKVIKKFYEKIETVKIRIVIVILLEIASNFWKVFEE